MVRINEKDTIRKMITIYCKDNHNNTAFLCSQCNDLLKYSFIKIEKCPHEIPKPLCLKCEIHCYNDDMRKKIKTVMKHSGSRMFLKHPVVGLKYLLKKIAN